MIKQLIAAVRFSGMENSFLRFVNYCFHRLNLCSKDENPCQVLANLLVKGNKPWINGIWFGFYRKNAFLNHFFGRGKYAGQQGNLSQLRTNPIQKLRPPQKG